VPQIVPAEERPSANSLTSLSWQISGVVGPALGAFIVAAGGTSLAFGLDSLSFLISAVCLIPLRFIRLATVPSEQKATPISDIREGLRTVTASPWLWVSILVFAGVNVTEAGPRNIALPFLIHDHLGLNVEALGLVASVFSIGSVTGAVVLGRARKLRRRGLLMYGATALGGLTVVLYGLAPNLAVLLGVALIYGVTWSSVSLVWANTLQEMVPQEKLGRISSIDALGSFVLMPVGFALAGVLTDRIGPAQVFIIGGCATMALAIIGLLHPGVRKLD